MVYHFTFPSLAILGSNFSMLNICFLFVCVKQYFIEGLICILLVTCDIECVFMSLAICNLDWRNVYYLSFFFFERGDRVLI
jgi:hypothetical protein